MRRITRQLDKLLSADGRDLEYVSLGFYCALFEFKQANRLSWGWIRGFFQACEFIDYRGDVSKTTLWDYLNARYDKDNNELPESIGRFFFRDPATRRYALSAAGIQARQEWMATLRRVLLDEKERYRLLYDRWNAEEKARRRAQKRFFQLTTDEQIRIARAFFSMPRDTVEQRRHVQAARKYLYVNFDVRPYDLIAIAKQYPVIQAVKHMPPGQETPATDPETIFRRVEQPGQTHDNTQ